MARYVLRRLAVGLLQLFAVATLVFLFLHLLPGDPAALVVGGDRATDPVVVGAVRAELGLDQPLVVQYRRWIGGLVTADLGRSLYDQRPVIESVAERLPRTLELIGVVSLLAPLVGIPLGVVAALQRKRFGGGLISALVATGVSVPVYMIGTVLVLVFGLFLRWFPASGYVDFDIAPARHLRALILPTVTLAFGFVAVVTQMTRSSMLEVLSSDFVRTARAKGLGTGAVLYRHVVPNGLVPVITAIALQMGSLLGGTVLVEYIFNWPGLSTLLVTAIVRRDYPVVQGVLLVTSAFFVLLTIAMDILYGAINPRIRYE